MAEGVDVYFEDHKESKDLGRVALRAGAASVVMQYGNGVLQLVGAVVLARLLEPEDFGLVAIVMVLTSFAPLLIDFGLGDATIQRSKITQSQVSSLFWLSVGIGLATAAAVALCGPLIAWIYREPRMATIAPYFAITFVLYALSSQHLALLRRSMQFSETAKIQILGTFVGAVVGIFVAFCGFGYWALVIRPIANSLCVAIAAWLSCRWRPGLPVLDDDVRSMVRFGMHVVNLTVIYTMARAVDRIALGLFYRPDTVGQYQNATMLYDNSILSVISQIHNVGSAALSKLQSNPAALRQKYEAALSALSFFVMPTAAILSVTAQDLTVMLLGEKWKEAGLLLSIMALRGVFHIVEGSHGWLYLATGRADRWRNWGIIASVIQVVAVAGGLPFGATGVAVAVAMTSVVNAIPSISYAGREIGIGPALVIRAAGRQLIGAITTAAAGWSVQAIALAHCSGLVRIIFSTCFCLSLYLVIVVVLFQVTDPMRVAFTIVQDQLLGKSIAATKQQALELGDPIRRRCSSLRRWMSTLSGRKS
jgi:O-antigen/teichoic acid export membrane protein